MLQQEEERPEILIRKVVSFDDGFDDEMFRWYVILSQNTYNKTPA